DIDEDALQLLIDPPTGCDADQFPHLIDKGTAAVARIDRRLRFNDQGVDPKSLHLNLVPGYLTHRARRVLPQGLAVAGIADRVNGFRWAGAFTRQFQRLDSLRKRVQFDEGQVAARIGVDHQSADKGSIAVFRELGDHSAVAVYGKGDLGGIEVA